MDTQRKVPYRFIIAAMALWLFAGSEIYRLGDNRLYGTVVDSATSCMQPYNSRCARVRQNR